MEQTLTSQKPPLYFVPTRVMCSCGQDMMIMEVGHTPPDLYVIVMCTQPWCSQINKDKKIPLNLFSFREYQDLPS